MNIFTSEFIKAQLALAEKATPRPWQGAGRPPVIVTNPPGPEHDIVFWGPDSNVEGQHDNWADIWYAVAAANNYPTALAEIDALRARVAQLEAAGDVLLRLWYVYNATDVVRAAEAWRKARG